MVTEEIRMKIGIRIYKTKIRKDSSITLKYYIIIILKYSYF